MMGNVQESHTFFMSHLDILCNIYGLQKFEDPNMTSKSLFGLKAVSIKTGMEDIKLLRFTS